MSYQPHNFQPGAVLLAGQLNEMDNEIARISGGEGVLSENVKQSLLECFENVAWINDQGQTYYDNLYNALYPPLNIESISAVFDSGSNVIYDNMTLDDLKQYLTVIATLTDYSTQTVTDYVLSGNMTAGNQTITVSYGGKTTTFTVTVVEWLTSITAVFTQGSAVIYDTDSLDTLKQYLVVTATYSDSTTATVTNYTLSGTLEVGTSTITVSYGGKTAMFSVVVSEAPLLPTEYQQVEYIKATGTQYINTGIVVHDTADTNANSVKLYTVDIDFTFDEWQSAYATNIVFAFNSGGGKWIGYNNTKQHIAMGTDSGMFFTTGTVTDRHSYHYEVSGTTGIWTRDDGASISRAVATSSVGNSTAYLFYYRVAGGGAQNGFHFNGKIYSCTVYKSGEKVADFIPCYRKSDSEIGLYDTVRSTFYTNAGTGTFLKGDNVA